MELSTDLAIYNLLPRLALLTLPRLLGLNKSLTSLVLNNEQFWKRMVKEKLVVTHADNLIDGYSWRRYARTMLPLGGRKIIRTEIDVPHVSIYTIYQGRVDKAQLHREWINDQSYFDHTLISIDDQVYLLSDNRLQIGRSLTGTDYLNNDRVIDGDKVVLTRNWLPEIVSFGRCSSMHTADYLLVDRNGLVHYIRDKDDPDWDKIIKNIKPIMKIHGGHLLTFDGTIYYWNEYYDRIEPVRTFNGESIADVIGFRSKRRCLVQYNDGSLQLYHKDSPLYRVPINALKILTCSDHNIVTVRILTVDERYLELNLSEWSTDVVVPRFVEGVLPNDEVTTNIDDYSADDELYVIY